MKIVADAKRTLKQNEIHQTRDAARIEKMRQHTKEVVSKFNDTEHQNATLRQDLSGLLRENEKRVFWVLHCVTGWCFFCPHRATRRMCRRKTAWRGFDC